MEIKTSWDDGSRFDLRMADLLEKYKLPGIFFIPNRCEHLTLTRQEIKDLSKRFDIGGHTKTHPEDLKRLSRDEQMYEIIYNKGYLESLINREIYQFCYPSGRYNEITIDILRKIGYKGARTTLVGSIDINQSNPFKEQTTVHAYPNRKEYNGQKWVEYAIDKFDKAKDTNGLFHIFGHSWEVEKYSLWEELEYLFQYMNK